MKQAKEQKATEATPHLNTTYMLWGFEETPGGLLEPRGITGIESESRLRCELETGTCRPLLGDEYARVKSGSPALLPIGMFLFFSFILCLSCFVFHKGALDPGCKTALAGWTGRTFFFPLDCQSYCQRGHTHTHTYRLING